MAWRRSGVRSPSAPPRWQVLISAPRRVGPFLLCPGEAAKVASCPSCWVSSGWAKGGASCWPSHCQRSGEEQDRPQRMSLVHGKLRQRSSMPLDKDPIFTLKLLPYRGRAAAKDPPVNASVAGGFEVRAVIGGTTYRRPRGSGRPLSDLALARRLGRHAHRPGLLGRLRRAPHRRRRRARRPRPDLHERPRH